MLLLPFFLSLYKHSTSGIGGNSGALSRMEKVGIEWKRFRNVLTNSANTG